MRALISRCSGRDLVRHLALELRALARADGGQPALDGAERREAPAHEEEGCRDEPQSQQPQRQHELAAIVDHGTIELVEIGRNDEAVAPAALVAREGVLLLQQPQVIAFGIDELSDEDAAAIGQRFRRFEGKLQLFADERLRGLPVAAFAVGGLDLPVVAGKWRVIKFVAVLARHHGRRHAGRDRCFEQPAQGLLEADAERRAGVVAIEADEHDGRQGQHQGGPERGGQQQPPGERVQRKSAQSVPGGVFGSAEGAALRHQGVSALGFIAQAPRRTARSLLCRASYRKTASDPGLRRDMLFRKHSRRHLRRGSSPDPGWS